MTDLLFIIATVVACVLAGFRLGWDARERAAKKFISDYFQQEIDSVKDTVVFITVSREGTYFLIHDRDSGEFLAQGTNHSDVTKVLHERFPSKKFIASPDNLKDVGYQLDDTI